MKILLLLFLIAIQDYWIIRLSLMNLKQCSLTHKYMNKFLDEKNKASNKLPKPSNK